MWGGVKAFAQSESVTGTVTGETGGPLVGVTVLVQDTGRAAASSIDGKYTIEAGADAVLVFSYVGYATQSVSVGRRTRIDVVLKEEVNSLDEVIVVGYGTQRKRDVVGAIEQVSGEIFEERSNPSIVRSMQGQIPGVNISMVDGKASRSADIKIRGAVNSIGAGGNALVLVDGVESDITAVNPDDIKSISVLKDASSAAVYGARGAFGVVLITTKDPEKRRVKINYNGNFSILNRTVVPDLVTDGWEWFKSYHTAYVDYQGTDPKRINDVFDISSTYGSELEKRYTTPGSPTYRVTDDGKYEYFDRVDWHKVFYKDYTTGTQHNLSLSGGSDRTTYYISGRYFQQSDIYNAGDGNFRQYNLRAKGSIRLTDWLKIENNTDFMRRTQRQPRVSADYQDRLLTVPRMIEHEGYPMASVTNPDGTWTTTAVRIGWAGFEEGDTYQDNFAYNMKNTTTITANLYKDVLILKGDISYMFGFSEQQRVRAQHEFSNGPGKFGIREEDINDYENRTNKTNYWATNLTLSYAPKLGDDHSLSALVGFNVEDKEYIRSLFKRNGLLAPDKDPNFSLMDGINYTMKDNGSYSWGFAGVFFRANYSYKGRYLAEISGRYDGTSKFPENQVWGFFPSASLGWRISEESFMETSRHWLDNLKLRVSFGTAGNGLVDPYKYLLTMPINRMTVIVDGNYPSYTQAPGQLPLSLTWEKATTYDVGLDLDMFRGRFNLLADFYCRKTTDMFTTGPEIPAVAGYAAPKGNYADMRTLGWELSVGWRDSFKAGDKDFNYNVKVSVWDSTSEITKYTGTTNLLPTIYKNNYYEGMEIGEIWGYHVDGLFATDAEAKEYGKMQQNFVVSKTGNEYMAGDIKLADLDGSGNVDNGKGTVDDYGDLRKIGNSSPRYHYGITAGFSWNGIGLSMFWQGVGRRDWFPAKESSYFWGHYGRPYGFCMPWQGENDRWTEQNQNVDAYWPRLRGYIAQNSKGIMVSTNDRYLQDASYIRLKNLTIDYTFPERISKRLGMSNLKIYLSGDNLLTFTPLKKYAKNFDPEVITSGDSDFSAAPGSEGDGYGYPTVSYTHLTLPTNMPV